MLDLAPTHKTNQRAELGPTQFVPAEWRLALLDKVAIRGTGHTPSRSFPEYWDGEIKWVSLADSKKLDRLYISETEFQISEHGLANSSAQLHPAETVILSRDAGVGKSAILQSAMAVSQHFVAWQCGPELVPQFLYYSLQAMKPALERIAVGNTIKTIGMGYFQQLAIWLPPRSEQAAIAEALSDADALIEELERLIAKKRAIKQGAMQELLSGRRRLPGFSGDWKTHVLGDLADFHKGKGLPKSSISASGEYSCIHYGELFSAYGVTIERVWSRTAGFRGAFRSNRFDVLMPTSDVTPRGLAKASCLLIDGVIVGGDTLVIRPNPALLDGAFLASQIRLQEEKILELVTGSTVFHLYASDMRKFEFLMPGKAEQEAISMVLREFDRELEGFEFRLRKARLLKQGMMQDLLTGRVRLM